LPSPDFQKIRKVKVRIKKMVSEAVIPTYVSSGSSGADLFSIVDKDIPSHTFALIPTGITIEIPEGIEAQIRPRSGLALKYGVTVLNTPGTIDSDYRGEVKVILINHGTNSFSVRKGMRIAQIVFSGVRTVTFEETDELDTTERGDGGFGHSGG
jgi:dUTP pyrophosphatase